MRAFASKKPAKTQYLTQKLIHIKPIDYAMRKQLIFILTAFFALNHSFAQTQQKLSYDIKVALNDQTNTLNAHESLAYTNNFDAQISVLYFHLWPNAYKNNQTAFAKQQLNSGKTKFYYAPDADKGYIDSLNFMVNGEKVKWELLTDSIDICRMQNPAIDFDLQLNQQVEFRTDTFRLSVILDNLLSNAVKYQKPEEGHPSVKLKIDVEHV